MGPWMPVVSAPVLLMLLSEGDGRVDVVATLQYKGLLKIAVNLGGGNFNLQVLSASNLNFVRLAE